MNDRIWTKEYVLLMASNLFVAANFYSLMSTSAGFAISRFGVSETMAGLGAGIFVVGALISRIIVGRYTTQLDLKKTLLIGTAALILCTGLLMAVNNFVVFCLLRFLGGATFGVNNNTLMTAVTYIIPEKRKGEGVNWYSLSQILGMAIGPFLAVFLMNRYDFNAVFLFVTFIAAAAFLMVAFVRFPKDISKHRPAKEILPASAPQDGTTAPAAPPLSERGIWQFFERSAIPIAVLCFILYFCNNNFLSFAAIFVTDSGAVNLSSLIFLVYAVAMLILRPIVGKIFDKYGSTQILVIGFILYAAGYYLLGRGATALFIPAALLLGFGISALQGSTLAIVVTNAPRHRLAIANATYFFSFDLGATVGPIVGGGVIEYMGYGMMYYICAIIVIACLPLYFGVLAKRANRLPA